MKTLSLYQLNSLLREVIETSLDEDYWVQAELSEVRVVRGHCYMELVEKDAESNTPIARSQAVCWSNTWQVLNMHFQRVARQPLTAGMKVLIQVHADYHEAYGFKWVVTDIDPTFTIGDLARRRQEIIEQLKADGVFDLQHELRLPLFCQRIAVISAENAAGYGDFTQQLLHNSYGFSFTTELFPAVMQGEQVEQSIIAALNSIHERREEFDCVVVIRGGGATADMSGFDTLPLAENTVNFPLPILTGIGHDRDQTVLDLISFQSVKTPTAAAAFLIDHLSHTAERIARIEHSLGFIVLQRIKSEQQQIQQLSSRLTTALRLLFTRKTHQLEMLQMRLSNLDPQLLLQRGYSLTLHNGHFITSVSQLQKGDQMETRFSDGSVLSTVIDIKNNHNE